MFKKYAFMASKGGVGKSTACYNVGYGFNKIGLKTLIIDLDHQNDSSLFLGIDKSQYSKVFDDLFDKRNPVKLCDCIIQAREDLYILPNGNLENVESELHRISRIDQVLRHVLKDLEHMDFDVVLFDTSPTRNKVNDAVLCYLQDDGGIIIPVQLQAASVRSIGNIYNYLADLYINPDIIKAVIPNMYNNTLESRDNLQFLNEFFEGQDVLTDYIPTRTKIAEAGKYGKSIFEYDEEASTYFMKVVEKLVSSLF